MKVLTHPSFKFEEELWDKGFTHVIGIDEVGRGAFAGPVVAASVIFENGTKFSDLFLNRVNDSKLLRPREREMLSKEITNLTNLWSISEIPVKTINKVGIGKATATAMRQCVKQVLLNPRHDKNIYFLLVDGFHIKFVRELGLKNQKAIIKGDQKSISIASASIIAKVYRDKLMKNYGRKFTFYNFGVNKGYGTKLHQKAMKEHGLCPIHRTSFNLSKFLQ